MTEELCLFDKEIVMKAQTTTYNHPTFFQGGETSVKYAISYLMDYGFGLRLKKGYRDLYGRAKLKAERPHPEEDGMSESDLVQWYAERRIWQPLCITCEGRDGGTDQGRLKVLMAITILDLPFIKLNEGEES